MRVKFTIDSDNNIALLTTDNEEIYIKVDQEGDYKTVFVSAPETTISIIEEENNQW